MIETKRRTSPSAAWLLAATLCIPALAQDAKTIEREGEHYRVVFHFGDLPAEVAGPMADAALASAEQIGVLASKLVRKRLKRGFEIHLYRSAPDFRSVENGSSPWRWQCSSFVTTAGVGHVLIEPELDACFFEHIGLPQTAVEGTLWAAAQQVIAPVVPAEPHYDWVKWALVIGAVESVTNPTHATGLDARHDQRRAAIASWLRHDEDLNFASLVERHWKVRTAGDWVWLASSAAVIAQTMAAENDKWASRLLRKHKLPRGQSGASAFQRFAAKAVFGKDWRKAEQAFDRVMQGADPSWTSLTVLWQPSADRSLLVGTKADSATLKLNPGSLPFGRFAVEGRIELGPIAEGGHKPVVFAFGLGGELSVNVGFEEGQTWISTWDVEKQWWNQRSRVGLPLARGEPFAFRIEVTEHEVRQFIDGKRIGAWKYEGTLDRDDIVCQVMDRIVWFDQLIVRKL